MTKCVLDASAVLAVVLSEEGKDSVLSLIDRPLVSTVNMAEARSKLADFGLTSPQISASLSLMDLDIIDFNDHQSKLSGDLRNETRIAGLSLGDRACIALAISMGAEALTTDRTWSKINLPISIRQLR